MEERTIRFCSSCLYREEEPVPWRGIGGLAICATRHMGQEREDSPKAHAPQSQPGSRSHMAIQAMGEGLGKS